MGQVLHLGTRTTEAARRAIQHSQARQRTLARRCGIPNVNGAAEA